MFEVPIVDQWTLPFGLISINWISNRVERRMSILGCSLVAELDIEIGRGSGWWDWLVLVDSWFSIVCVIVSGLVDSSTAYYDVGECSVIDELTLGKWYVRHFNWYLSIL